MLIYEASRVQEILADLNTFLCCAGSSVFGSDRKGRSIDRIRWGRGRGVEDKRSICHVTGHMFCPGKRRGKFWEGKLRAAVSCVVGKILTKWAKLKRQRVRRFGKCRIIDFWARAGWCGTIPSLVPPAQKSTKRAWGRGYIPYQTTNLAISVHICPITCPGMLFLFPQLLQRY